MENVGVKQQSVKFLLSLKSNLNLPELTVMFGLERSITLQLRDDLKKWNKKHTQHTLWSVHEGYNPNTYMIHVHSHWRIKLVLIKTRITRHSHLLKLQPPGYEHRQSAAALNCSSVKTECKTSWVINVGNNRFNVQQCSEFNKLLIWFSKAFSSERERSWTWTFIKWKYQSKTVSQSWTRVQDFS